MPRRAQPLTLLVKPAGPECNMACSYCFYTRKQALFPAPSRMSLETLEILTRQALGRGGREVSFIWQGGEPTLMGLSFFEEAIGLQQRYGQPGQQISNALMTNGVLLDDAWCRFLAEAGFLVGLSLDGPKDLHDSYRRLRGGAPSWDRAVAAAQRLMHHAVPANALVLATDLSCARGPEIFDTLVGLGFRHLQVVPCVEADPARRGSLAPFSVTPEGYGQLMCDLLGCWAGAFPAISLRWLDGLLHRYLGLPPTECTLCETCGGYLVVEHNGSVYACDFYVDEGHELGNLREGRLAAMLSGTSQRAFGQAKGNVVPLCLECPWLALCQGGCPKDRLASAEGRSYLCAAYQRVFAQADPVMRKLARDPRRHRAARVGRNAPCPCGSGRKFKHCCGK